VDFVPRVPVTEWRTKVVTQRHGLLSLQVYLVVASVR
jgi:hypothetical protein